MRKEQFESRMRELLPKASDAALKRWTEYAQELDQDGTEPEANFYDSTYVELTLIKQHQGVQAATALFNYGEHFTFNPFELRGAASPLNDGWPLDKIQAYAVENGCDPTEAEYEESQVALQAFQESRRQLEGDMSVENIRTPINTGNRLIDAFIKAMEISGGSVRFSPYGPGMDCHLPNLPDGVQLGFQVEPYIYFGSEIQDPDQVETFTVQFFVYTQEITDKEVIPTFLSSEEIERLLDPKDEKMRRVCEGLKEMNGFTLELNRQEYMEAEDVTCDWARMDHEEILLQIRNQSGPEENSFGVPSLG